MCSEKGNKSDLATNKKANQIVSRIVKKYCNWELQDWDSFIGYNYFGPFLYGYIKWLHENLSQKKYDVILFLSRDGQLMKRAYEEAYGSNNAAKYFFASRKGLLRASFWINMDYEYIIDSMFIPSRVSLGWILNKWGIDNTSKLECLNKFHLDIDEELDGKELKYNQTVKDVYEYLKVRIYEHSRESYAGFRQYLKTVIGTAKSIAIVDIGWYGNMQKAFSSMVSMNNEILIDGYYLGIVPESKNQERLNMHGYLFEKGKNEKLYNFEKNMNSLLEMFFMADHGTLVNYEYSNENYSLCFDNFEYVNEDAQTAKIFKSIQEGALLFVSNFKGIGQYLPCDEFAFSKGFLDFFLNPSLKVAKAFGNMRVKDEAWRYVAKPTKSVFNLKKFLREFTDAPWKVGYLKRIFKIPLPYIRILSILEIIKKGVK